MNSDKFILNPQSGRFIAKNGTLHRRLMRKNIMPVIEVETRKPRKLSKPVLKSDEVRPSSTRSVEDNEKVKENVKEIVEDNENVKKITEDPLLNLQKKYDLLVKLYKQRKK